LLMNLSSVLEATKDGSRISFIDMSGAADRAFTFEELNALVDAVAAGLAHRFGAMRARIGILAQNSVEYAALYLGAMRAGCVIVPISTKMSADVVAYVLADAEIELLFISQGRNPPAGVQTIVIGSEDWSKFLRGGPFLPVEAQQDEWAQILYTSGSTGRPKGVALTHAGQLWAVEKAASLVEDGRSYRVLVAAPMFHMNALFNLKRSLRLGASLVVLPEFRAPQYCRAIELYRCDWLTCVPAMMGLLARHVGNHTPPEFKNVRRIFMSSSSFSPQLLETVMTMFPSAAVLNSYGTTEAGPHVFEGHPQGKPTPTMSCGYPTSSDMVRLVDQNRRPIEGSGEGILEMKTPAIMRSYLNLPELTKEYLREGWYHSRDIMRRDADGFYYFIGRSDDMFTCGGENIYPVEVEQVLEKHPDVEQAVVVSIPDEIKQNLPVAFIVPRSGSHPAETALKSWFIERAPAYMHPRHIAFIEQIPLGPTSKIDRRALAERARMLAART
jgi:long-chain acyl-CoA synthetase